VIRLAEVARQLLNEVTPSKHAIHKAVKGPYLVKVKYLNKNGSLGGDRFLLPVAYGLTTRGNPVVRAYQFDGHTETLNPKWKLFLVSKIKSWYMTGRKMAPPELYNPSDDRSMARVDFQY
jgi:hypothetical protein